MKQECPLEHDEQTELVKWWRRSFPKVRIFAIPNGGKRGKREAMRLKAEGVTAGVPDLYIPALRVWVEMKRQKGAGLSDKQKDWREYLEGIGDVWITGRGCEDAKNQLEKVLNDRRLIK